MVLKARGKEKKFIKKKSLGFAVRRKRCRLCAEKIKSIDYKDSRRLEMFIRERGKIISSRYSGNCAHHQRMVSEAIKKARYVSLLPYVR